jgi:hypothetical protein
MSIPLPTSPPPAYSSLPTAQRPPQYRLYIPQATLHRSFIRMPPPPTVHVTGYETILDALPPYSRDVPILPHSPLEVTLPTYLEVFHENEEDNPLYNASYRPNYWESEHFMRTGRVRGSPTPEPELPPIIHSGPGYISPQSLHINSPLAMFARQDAAVAGLLEDLLREQNERHAAAQVVDAPSPPTSGQDEAQRNVSRPGSRFDPEAEDAESNPPLPHMNDATTQIEQILSLGYLRGESSWKDESIDDQRLGWRGGTRSRSSLRRGLVQIVEDDILQERASNVEWQLRRELEDELRNVRFQQDISTESPP